MSAREPRWEVVHTGARQWHARFRAANGQVVWVTESYTRRRDAIHAIDLLERSVNSQRAIDYREVDERRTQPQVDPAPYTITSVSGFTVKPPTNTTIWSGGTTS